MTVIRVYHAGYGCDTGCCGHRVEVDGKDVGDFEFMHPYGKDKREWAVAFARGIIAKERPGCLETIDWSTVDVSEVMDD